MTTPTNKQNENTDEVYEYTDRTRRKLNVIDIWRLSNCSKPEHPNYIGIREFSAIVTYILRAFEQEVKDCRIVKLPCLGAFRLRKRFRKYNPNITGIQALIKLKNPNYKPFKNGRAGIGNFMVTLNWERYTSTQLGVRKFWRFKAQRQVRKYLVTKANSSMDFVDKISN